MSDLDDAMQTVFEAGLGVRREVLGSDHVDRSLSGADDFTMPMQRLATQMGWGAVWTRPGLAPKTRSLLNLAMLTALNRPEELKIHVAGALRNGVSVEEIREVLLHAAAYCGVPAGLGAFKAAHEALTSAGALAAPAADGGAA